MVVHLEKVFGFLPEVIVVEKKQGSSNTMRIIAVLTPAEMEKEDKYIAQKAKDLKTLGKKYKKQETAVQRTEVVS